MATKKNHSLDSRGTFLKRIPSSPKSDFANKLANWPWDAVHFLPPLIGDQTSAQNRVGLIKKALKSRVFVSSRLIYPPFEPQVRSATGYELLFRRRGSILGELPVKWVLKSCKHMPRNPREATQYQSNFGGWGEIPTGWFDTIWKGKQPCLPWLSTVD